MAYMNVLVIRFEPGYEPTEIILQQLGREIKRKLPKIDDHLEWSDTVGIQTWEMKHDYDE